MVTLNQPHWQNASPLNHFVPTNSSFLHSQTRKTFLLSINKEETAETYNEVSTKKTPVKKVSFKIKKTSSVHRRMQKLPVNKVAELTMKFNMINETSKSDKVPRKSSVKKPVDDAVIVRTKSAKSEERGSVRQTIEIFEKRTKPQIPEKPANLKKTEDLVKLVKPAVPQKLELAPPNQIKPAPNSSFLWSISQDKSPSNGDWKDTYDFVDPNPPKVEEKIYEELNNSYEYCDDGYEICSPPKENIYETLPPLLPRRQLQEPLPPRPPSRTSYTTQNTELVSNCYESIEEKSQIDVESNYESIYGCQIKLGGSSRDSLISSDQQSNSLYGRGSLVGWGDEGTNQYSGKATSDLSTSDRSDDWVDVSDNDENNGNNSEILVIRERQKPKKTTGWSQQFREQWSKSPRKLPPDQCDSDHTYETLATAPKEVQIQEDDYDSFDSDSESETSITKVNSNDSGLDIGSHQLPDPPNNQTYALTRFAANVKKRLRRNWSLTKNDISKSLSRMTKRKSRPELTKHRKSSPEITTETAEEENKNVARSLLSKFRRSMSLSTESANELTMNLDKPKSTFYLSEEVDEERDSGASLSPVPKSAKVVIRPHSPPPPVPVSKGKREKRSTSWYAEVGLFKNAEMPRRPNTFWYAEVGLYQDTKSTPSTSSAENSGTNVSMKTEDFINHDSKEEYYNFKNSRTLSVSSTETKKDSFTNLTTDKHLRLEDEPLYQFYDAAVVESVCNESTSDFDSDGYEEVEKESQLTPRPSAMDLVRPQRNSFVSRTLWCEVPEVIQSSVLSALSPHQKKLQEAKFEMITSEASYLNSLNVLHNHFIANLESSDLLTKEEFEVLFGKVSAVKNCSEKLLKDLDKCWLENILLHGVCDIIKQHAEENFHVYVDYCENQILLDETLRRLKDKPVFFELLRQVEASSTCQALTLYSFLMLPMQRITRWPLLVDAVLKRLSPQDSEYVTCQVTLATISKVVIQCNEGARRKERETELKKISTQLEFARLVPSIEIISEDRWLIRSGSVTRMQQRTDEIKLTFGKRFIKSNLHLFLFNNLLLVTKPKSDSTYTVIHYCPRNLVELSSTDSIASLPQKDIQGRHLLFLTMLENQDDKTVELLLSCNSESDKERWIEAFTPPKSEDPDETLYECWDCPQVTAVHNYAASQPDELPLTKGDVINVLRKMADGWYNGERIRDGQTGWFPANYTAEIANPHVRSRNLKQRYRFLAFSESYLKTK